MKKVFLLLCLFAFLCGGLVAYAFSPSHVGSGKHNAGCTIPGSADVASGGSFNSTNTLAGATAEGQSWASGAGGQLAKFCVYGTDEGTNGTITCRIGTGTDLSSYMEEFVSGTISSDDWICWDSVDQDTFTASTTYYWGCIESSGDTGLGTDNTNPYADGKKIWGGTGWAMGAEHDSVDHLFEIYWCD